MLRRKHATTGTCPGCGSFEDHMHLLRCDHKDMDETYTQEVQHIDDWLKTSTSASIRYSIISLLLFFRNTHQDPQQTSLTVQRKQQAFGWQAFFAGAWHNEWVTLQQEHYDTTKSQRSVTHWAVQLLHKVQMLPIHMWHTRNNILHSTETNAMRFIQHTKINRVIDEIYERKPHPRLMSHCDNTYFSKHTKDQIKKFKIRRKTNWIRGANLILTKYDRTLTEQSERFTSFFQWDRG